MDLNMQLDQQFRQSSRKKNQLSMDLTTKGENNTDRVLGLNHHFVFKNEFVFKN